MSASGSKTPPSRAKSVSPPLSALRDDSPVLSPSLARKLKKDESKREAYLSQEIDKALKEEELERKRNVIQKMLLLGPADSGKTTLLKQMKILHGDGFSDNEREVFRVKIINNVMRAMHAILKESTRLSFALAPENTVKMEKESSKLYEIQFYYLM
jgi:hypothetical protein